MYASILPYVINMYQTYDSLQIIQLLGGGCTRTPPLKSQIRGIEKFRATKLCLSSITNSITSHDISIIKPRVKKLSDARPLFHPLICQKNLRVLKCPSTTGPEIRTVQEKKLLRLFHQVKELQYPLCTLTSHFFKNLATKDDISNLRILSISCLDVDEGVVSQTFLLVQQLCGIGLLKEVRIEVYGNIEIFITSQLLRKNNGIKWEFSSWTFHYFRVGVKYLFDSAIKMENNIIKDSKIIFKNLDYLENHEFSFVDRVSLITPENWDTMAGSFGEHCLFFTIL
eukprot:snap_masked-scaffold_15-processed-gene-10.16-mRNA-1 protein AED:1.00 eAED:1.00 QI:0/0/0/0/1/1/3/0/282